MPDLELWLNRNLANYERKYSILSERDKSLIMEWLNSSQRPTSIPRISVPQALEKANRWKLRQEYKKLTEEDYASLEVVYKTQPQFQWVKLHSDQNYLREGSLMQHCVSEYYKTKRSSIYSLRDIQNNPLATLEYDQDSNQIFQIKGPKNGIIKKDYHSLVREFVDYKLNRHQALFPDSIAALLDLGNFGHVIYQHHLYNSEEFSKFSKLKDRSIIAHQLTLDTFPLEVEADLLYIKNIKGLKNLKLKAKIKTLVICYCSDLESFELEGSVDQLIIDNCPRLKVMPKKLKLQRLIMNRCPKIKQVAKILEVEECLIIKCFIQSLANECQIEKLVMFNVKIQSFADIFKVRRFLFSHLTPLNGSHFKMNVAPLVSQVRTVASLNYWDTIAFYCYQYNFIDEDNCQRFAQENTDKSIKDYEAKNLERLDELSLIFNYPLGFKDLYLKLIDYLKHKFF